MTFSQKEQLDLIEQAHYALADAIAGRLETADGLPVVPRMSHWINIDEDRQVCYACLAGCRIIAQQNAKSLSLSQSIDEAEIFLDKVRNLPGYGHEYLVEFYPYLAEPAWQVRKRLGHYVSYEADHVLALTTAILEYHGRLPALPQVTRPAVVTQPVSAAWRSWQR